VHLPLDSQEKCDACGKTGSEPLRLCASCAEGTHFHWREYQKEDWPNHKKVCGETFCAHTLQSVRLLSFYPFLACLAEATTEAARLITFSKLPRPVLSHTIVNSPNPGSQRTTFPGGSASKVVLLGEHAAMPGTPTW
ncbi:hypothetical protein B0H19DRAFT_924965, partial [Mycena capillaripes]